MRNYVQLFSSNEVTWQLDDVGTRHVINTIQTSNLLLHSRRPKLLTTMTAPKNPRNQISNRTAGTSTIRNSAANIVWFALVATAVKLLFVPAYRSTDFEVHRHWLAITHSLPLSDWYSDETSQWTLDYPPLFAHFERFLSLFARHVDPTIVDLHKGLNYSSPSVILFQRVTVIVSDTVLFYGIYRLTRYLGLEKRILIWVLVIWSPGLLIVDHLHFQYNGFLLGILLLSLSWLEEGKDLMGGFVFAVLLCFKHLFVVAAPVYFVYLLRHYCRGGLVRGFWRLLVIGTLVAAVFVAAYGPFVYYGQVMRLSLIVEFTSLLLMGIISLFDIALTYLIRVTTSESN